MDAERNLVDKCDCTTGLCLASLNRRCGAFYDDDEFTYTHRGEMKAIKPYAKGFQMMHEIPITPKTLSDSRRAYLQFSKGIGEQLLQNHQKFDLSHSTFPSQNHRTT